MQRQVRVVDRSTWGTTLPYPTIRTVTLEWVCPICGVPRGEPRPHNFVEDGGYLTCDTWQNPCGHVDMYDDVLQESPEGPTCRNNPYAPGY
jgi:hypothetical protein